MKKPKEREVVVVAATENQILVDKFFYFSL